MVQQQQQSQQRMMELHERNDREKLARKTEKEREEERRKQEDDKILQLEKKLEEFQENARFIGDLASNFQTKYQDALNGRIYTLVRGLQDLDRMKGTFSDKKVPLDLLPYLDDGKNPCLYSKHCMEKTLEKNKAVNGKIEIYKKFRAHLMKEFSEEMPDLVMYYRSIREDLDLS
uniref:Mediator of RNA polymerase II transcription subunit 10 n=2 Tax=Caenorhabditis elegans TaxID=6239 RepID=MED10_CAEEL|nr:RecName: Full=Mediator of RNA polymerase II transcription subunit 10; AltName: Full=CeMED10; AltName: Full=CeNUT2; AltName: Full=Mediator complex subunit 10 [Caenorhabditis elegans]